MDESLLLQRTNEYVRNALQGEATGHDWWHISRVYKSALIIGSLEDANLFIVQLAALLHDIGDWKFHGGDDTVGAQMAGEWLTELGADPEVADHVCQIIRDISFKGAGVRCLMHSKEGMVVQDADRLDALGAIGIARAFAYGGHVGQEIYNPSLKPQCHETFEEYKASRSTTINHFSEKLLLLKDRMNTETGKRMAEQRHRFMETYLDRFFEEWECADLDLNTS